MREKVLKIILCLISVLIIIPSNVMAMEKSFVHNNGLYILRLDDDVNNRNGMTTSNTNKSRLKSDMCSDELREMLNKAWKIIMIFSPALLILMTSIDFFKAITSGDSDKLKKSSGNALKRTLAFVLLILLKFILSTVFGWVGLDLCL